MGLSLFSRAGHSVVCLPVSRLITMYWPDGTIDTCRVRVGVLLAVLEEEWIWLFPTTGYEPSSVYQTSFSHADRVMWQMFEVVHH
jgi:hypothetical protein